MTQYDIMIEYDGYNTDNSSDLKLDTTIQYYGYKARRNDTV